MAIRVYYNTTKYGEMHYLENDILFVEMLKQGFVWDQYFVENHLEKIIKKSKFILDIGAHCGSHSIMYSHMNPDAIIYSFEPQFKLYEVLKLNVTHNNRNNVKTFKMALGNKVCQGFMSNKYPENSAISETDINDTTTKQNYGSLQIGQNGESIEINTIDNLKLPFKVDFIKLDVEGFEIFVIDGGMNTIRKDKPVIFFEYNKSIVTDAMSSSCLPVTKNILDILLELDYKIIEFDEGNYLGIHKIQLLEEELEKQTKILEEILERLKH